MPARQGTLGDLPTQQTNFTEAHDLYLCYQRMMERVIDVFGDEIRANLWLCESNAAFGNQTPMQVARLDSYRLETLEPVLMQLEHGIYT